MNADKLILGHPYVYQSMDGHKPTEIYNVQYSGLVALRDGRVCYNFRFLREVKAGFVNLSKEQVENQITLQ